MSLFTPDSVDVMLDLELMGKDHDAAIVSAAACVFQPFGGEDPTLEEVRERGFNQAIGLKSALKAGLSMTPDNILWWFQQPKVVREAILNDPLPIREALSQLRKYLAGLSGDNPKRLRMWSMPAAGDLVILENAYAALGGRVPWLGKGRYCLSTLKRSLPVKQWPASRLDNAEKHVAIVDVHRQIIDARHACRLLASIPEG